MASLSTLAWILTRNHTYRVLTTISVQSTQRLVNRTFANETDTADSSSSFEDYESDDAVSIEELKNVSRLSPNHFKQYHGNAPDLPYKDLHRRRMLYAKFGSVSQEDPRILWPSRKELMNQEQMEIEEGGSFHERLAALQEEKEAAEKARIERAKMIEKNMSQMPKWIAEYHNKQEMARKEAKERAAKKEALLEEARDYFGYKIQANDPKFQKMVEEKEEKEKKEAKKKKKEEKLKKQEARLAQTT